MCSRLHLVAALLFVVGQIGDPFGGDGGIFGDLLAGIIAELQAVIAFLWNVLVAVANFLLSVLNFIWQFLNTLLRDVLRGFKWIWNGVIKVALTKLVNVFVRVQAWLQKTFGPLLRWLRRIRAWLDQYFNLYVKPILNAIQHVRQFLQLLRLLGFKWAAKLDAILAKVQNDIIKAYELIRQNLNQITSWLQLIVDPTFLLRRVPLFGALIRSAQELRNLELRATVHPITQDEADKMNRNRTWFLPAARADNFQMYQQGQLPPDIEEARKQFVAVNINPGDVSAS